MKNLISKLFRPVIAEEVQKAVDLIRNQDADNTERLARLMLDIKGNNLTLESRAFLMKLNIHPDEFSK